ncbi:conserved hypothetical protein [Alteromonas macleodii]|uniref:Uncharacterized protein n=1 Tax=Alteromonas macleodii TaxID=28108 RepID=A0A126PXH5_ALTMA|nr:hypothetical protein I636_05950 [Alteromonas mediterranea UM4b]AMJ97724.1 hypothetical protein AVL55_05830 [Alteromonas macleodii]KZY41173.1 hypothetical protein A3733_22335 [Pseudoalteromonas shioyasakiensis]MEC8964135.1 hypothetical protein [Pseudomonadota bacterium]TMO41720.1 hypothetical protein CWC25_18490 [Pseudoalteromonas sp. S4389]
MPWDWQVRWSARCRIFEGFEGSTQTILTIDLFDAVDMMRILVVSRPAAHFSKPGRDDMHIKFIWVYGFNG